MSDGSVDTLFRSVPATMTAMTVTGLSPGVAYTVSVATVTQPSATTRRLLGGDRACTQSGCDEGLVARTQAQAQRAGPTPATGVARDRKLEEITGDIGNATTVGYTTPLTDDIAFLLSASGTYSFANNYSLLTDTIIITDGASDANAIDLTFTTFDLEPDHDTITVLLDDVALWSGGARRAQFTLTLVFTRDVEHTITVRLTTDDTVQGTCARGGGAACWHLRCC